ncbi:ATP-binding cassette domain-containing protein [Glaciecola petra]|uniref:ATP-binding cassette domain-containing protein n=1 Tax=Glaciecola petra TaxID=3075602 RepID=A0ABU2ZPZ1_9ALTE|nr:ATP-binding cassette domain-containing protein [Aestuariibacter sp. P117]MDT0594693.1 ATP-binding cassette domain-containing protein [Aestuariibacter sp. P117]
MSKLTINLKHTLARQNRDPLHIAFNYSLDTQKEILGIYGPSGTGKSSILKAVSGQLSGTSGTLTWQNEHCIYDNAYENPCVYLGSETVLFEHLDVFANLELITTKSLSAKNAVLSLQDVVELCDLQDILSQKTQHLSGGERQRVCFARALLSGKPILLLDEAFSALDWQKRAEMLDIVKHLHANYALAFICVSHSLKELSISCTQIAYINEGTIIKQGDAAVMQDYLLNTLHANESYFSSFKAVFSHVEEDDHLLVWELPVVDSPNWVNTHGASPEKKQYVYQKMNEKAPRKLTKEQVFVVDAHVLMLSQGVLESTSVLNCLKGYVIRIKKEEQAVLVNVNVNGQVFAASISYKSFNLMEISLEQCIYVCFKAL